MCPIASARLGVRPISKIKSSSRSKYFAAFVPIATSFGKTIIPECEFPSPSSSSAQIIPKESTPLIFAALILKGSSGLG